jgi:hypothetical protein
MFFLNLLNKPMHIEFALMYFIKISGHI